MQQRERQASVLEEEVHRFLEQAGTQLDRQMDQCVDDLRDLALAVAEKEVSRVTAAKAADDLLSLQGVQASVVLYRQGDGVSMSGRSLGEVNVQVILERLGGGGNATAAGGHVSGADLYAVRQRVAEAIEDYYAP